MNAYVVKTKEMRSYTESVMDDGSGPRVPYWPIAPVVANSPAQAKHLFLIEFEHRSDSGVYGDDWNSLSVRLLARDVDMFNQELTRGVHEESDWLWGRIHEVEDHAGRACDCPEMADIEFEAPETKQGTSK